VRLKPSQSLLVTALLAASLMMPNIAEGQLVSAQPPACTSGYTLPAFTDCSGAWVGNDANQQVDVLAQINSDWSLGWTVANLMGKTDAGNSGDPFSVVPGTTSGTIQFSNAYQGTFVLILKGGNAFSMYLFENATLSSVDFDMAGVTGGNGRPVNGLSHASLWGAEGTVVPEPATVFLLGTGLLGLGIVGYRRRKET